MPGKSSSPIPISFGTHGGTCRVPACQRQMQLGLTPRTAAAWRMVSLLATRQMWNSKAVTSAAFRLRDGGARQLDGGFIGSPEVCRRVKRTECYFERRQQLRVDLPEPVPLGFALAFA